MTTSRRRAATALWLMATLAACSGPPQSTARATPDDAVFDEVQSTAEQRSRLGRRRSDLPGDCEAVPGKPPPAPLEREYNGVAAKARCQREVYSIMGGVAHFLDVECTYCHVKGNYAAMTHRKRVANWMARELIPRLEKRDGSEVWCNDCHTGMAARKNAQHGRVRRTPARLLGDPRDESWAIEWMSRHLTERFRSGRGGNGGALHCRDCHGGDLGTPGFQRRIILSERTTSSAPGSDVQKNDTTRVPAAE